MAGFAGEIGIHRPMDVAIPDAAPVSVVRPPSLDLDYLEFLIREKTVEYDDKPPRFGRLNYYGDSIIGAARSMARFAGFEITPEAGEVFKQLSMNPERGDTDQVRMGDVVRETGGPVEVFQAAYPNTFPQDGPVRSEPTTVGRVVFQIPRFLESAT